MKASQKNQLLTRAGWAPPLAICFILFILLLIAGTIVLALIPLYLSTKDIQGASTQNAITFNALFASDLQNGRALTVSNINGLSSQMMSGIPRLTNSLNVQSAQFMAATASAKKRDKHQIMISCEQPTGLNGDILQTETMMEFPPMCTDPSCQTSYYNKMLNSIRKKIQRKTVTMNFANGETRVVRLSFCSFSTPVTSNTTTPLVTTTNTIIPLVTTAPTTSSSNNTTPITGCTSYIYLLDQDGYLFQFNPITFDVTSIGMINCSTTAYPYSMALQNNGQAWTLFTDGNLYKFDIKTGQCQATSYVSDPDEIILFGMYFAPNGSNNTETLYISADSSDPPYHLATMDINTFEVTVVGYYQIISARAELAGSNDGRLFGLFEGAPYIIAEINQTDGQILSETSQNMIQYTPDSSYFAFTSYLSNFFLFVGNFSYTNIFLYNSSTKTTTKQNTIANGIVGSGMSTCM